MPDFKLTNYKATGRKAVDTGLRTATDQMVPNPETTPFIMSNSLLTRETIFQQMVPNNWRIVRMKLEPSYHAQKITLQAMTDLNVKTIQLLENQKFFATLE